MLKIYLLIPILLLILSCTDESLKQNLIEEQNLHKHIKEISSDKYQGRAPGTQGGLLTKEYLVNQLMNYGLEPLKDSFLIKVPLVESEVQRNSEVSILNGKNKIVLTQGKDIVFWTKKLEDKLNINQSELVFVGYGIVAPEYEWNDYKDINMQGKIAVVLINDPGFATKDPNLFTGNAMTYYGRWKYKIEEASRQGAEGIMIIHDTEPAAYPWQVVETSWLGKQIDLDRRGNMKQQVKMESWLSNEIAKSLFNLSGLNLEKETQASISKDFKPKKLSTLSLNASINNDYNFRESHNIVGIKKGNLRPEEYILSMAHWDHLGMKDLGEDKIYNGAIDNATGVAGVLELAETLKDYEMERSVLFLFVTAEESGLLGSEHFATYPSIKLSNIVAGFNFDAIYPTGQVRDVIVVGHGASELEDLLSLTIKKYDKYIKPDPFPEKGYFYRSDHISLAKKGVPVLYADGGLDKLEGGTQAGELIAQNYTKNDYHQPSDEYDSKWDLSGFVEHLEITKEMILSLSNSSEWPNWYEGNEFKSIRDKSRENN